MINDLDETLKQLLIQKAQLDPAEVDISFDTPTRDWSTPVTRPTINLYLFDIRENRTLRELDWDDEPSGYGQVRRKRLPLRMDLSYMVTCWTSATEDQHRLRRPMGVIHPTPARGRSSPSRRPRSEVSTPAGSTSR